MAGVRMYRAHRRDKDGHIAAPALIFEARDDAAAIFWARACFSDENVEVWENERRVSR
jgi:hypothetical protein